jgi:hypothetical protein
MARKNHKGNTEEMTDLKKIPKINLKKQDKEKIIELVNKQGEMTVKDAMRLIMNSQWVSSTTAIHQIKDIIIMQKVDIKGDHFYSFEDCILLKHLQQ